MTHFWVRVAMKKLTVHQGAADAGADGKVNQVARLAPLPKGFSQHSAVDVSIEADGQEVSRAFSENRRCQRFPSRVSVWRG